MKKIKYLSGGVGGGDVDKKYYENLSNDLYITGWEDAKN